MWGQLGPSLRLNGTPTPWNVLAGLCYLDVYFNRKTPWPRLGAVKPDQSRVLGERSPDQSFL